MSPSSPSPHGGAEPSAPASHSVKSAWLRSRYRLEQMLALALFAALVVPLADVALDGPLGIAQGLRAALSQPALPLGARVAAFAVLAVIAAVVFGWLGMWLLFRKAKRGGGSF